MIGEIFELYEGPADRELDELESGGSVDTSLALLQSEAPRAPVLVRPIVSDPAGTWLARLEEAVSLERGTRIAFTGEDPVVAGQLAASLAAWLADRGRSVVLVDASVESPILGKALAEDGDEGLVDAAIFGVSASAVARRTLASGVRLVTAGSHPISVDRVFEKGSLGRLVDELGQDAVLIFVVPERHMPRCAGVLGAAVIAGRNPDEIVRLATAARSAGSARNVGVLVRRADEVVTHQEAREVPEAHAARQQAEAAASVKAGPPVSEAAPRELHPEREPTVAVPRGAAGRRPREPKELKPRTLEKGAAAGERAGSRRSKGPAWAAVAVVVVAALAVGVWLQTRGPGEEDEPPRVSARQHDAAEEIAPGTARPISAGEDSEGAVVGRPGDAASGDTDRRSGGRPEGGFTRGVAPAGGPGGPYRVLVSSHKHESAAAVESAQLEERGLTTEVVMAEIEGRGSWYRVVIVGGYPTLRRARAVLDSVKQLGYEGAWIERISADEPE